MEDTSFKQSLRARFRAGRRNLDTVTRQHHDLRINQEILDRVAQVRANPTATGLPDPASKPFAISAYLSFDGEPDVRPALGALVRQGIRVVVPAIVSISGTRELEFRDWTPEGLLAQSALGIDQPEAGNPVLPQDLDIMLMPLVSWDENGHRLGMGAGYYDRSLASLAGSRRPLRIGIAYALQKHAGLPVDPWDVRLHEIISDEGRFTCVA